MGPMAPQPLMIPAARAACSREPESIAPAPESKESGPITMTPTSPRNATNAYGDDNPSPYINDVTTTQPTVITAMALSREPPKIRSEAQPAASTPRKPIQSN